MSVVNKEIILITEAILEKVPKEKKVRFDKSERELFSEVQYEPEDDLYDGGVATIAHTLSGWRLDIFKMISMIQGNTFQLAQIYTQRQHLQQLY